MLKKILFILLAVGFLLAIILTFRTIQQNKILKSTTLEDGFEYIEYPPFETTSQSIFVRGTKRDNPILLFVHGGPGSPQGIFTRFYEQELLEDYTIVHFDQRGTGLSIYPDIDWSKLQIEDYVEDILLIASYLQDDYPRADIFLTGHSWGTLIGLLAAQKRPDLFKAYIGIAQLTDMKHSEILSYNFAMAKAEQLEDEAAISQLQDLGNPPFYDYEKVIKEREILRKMGGMDVDIHLRSKLTRKGIFTPDYSLSELWRAWRVSLEMPPHFWKKIMAFNAFEAVPQLDLPVYFLEGRQDYQVPSELAAQYLDSLKAPVKQLIWFEKSGHLPIYEENEKYVETMKNIKKEVLGYYDNLARLQQLRDSIDYDTTQWRDIYHLDKSIAIDIRYATENNFVEEKMYECGRCLMRPEVAKAVIAVHKELQTEGLGLKMLDCYRPRPVQWKLWNKVPDARYVTNPNKGSQHNRGTAVDLTLVDEKGRQLDMGTPYDYFGREAYQTYTNLPDSILARRQLLNAKMTAHGFKTIRTEWWHFSYIKKSYPLSDMLWNCW